MGHIDITEANAIRLMMRDLAGPVVMLNLLRFRDVADYSGHPDLAPEDPISGEEAYRRYFDHTRPFLAASGSEVIFYGAGGHNLIGPDDERWDAVMLVRHASVEKFLAMGDNRALMAGMGHRIAALEDSRLIPVVPESVPTS